MFVSFKTTGRQTMKIKSELSKSLTVPYLRSLSSLPSFVQVLSVLEITKGRQRILQVNSSHSSKSQKTLFLDFCPILSCPRNHRRRTAETTSAAWRTSGGATTPPLPSARSPSTRSTSTRFYVFLFFLFLIFSPFDFHLSQKSVASNHDCR